MPAARSWRLASRSAAAHLRRQLHLGVRRWPGHAPSLKSHDWRLTGLRSAAIAAPLQGDVSPQAFPMSAEDLTELALHGFPQSNRC
jgi:hypothetical protein